MPSNSKDCTTRLTTASLSVVAFFLRTVLLLVSSFGIGII